MNPSPPDHALQQLAGRLFEDPSDGAAHAEAARLHLAAGRPARAAAHLRVAVAADPDSAERWSALAGALLAAGRLDDAGVAANRALALDESGAQAWSVAAALDARAGRFDSARARFERALALQPAFEPALLGLAANEEACGRLPEAIDAYRRAIAANARSAAAHYALAVIFHRRMGALDPAIEHYRAALAAEPAHASSHHNLAHALLLQGRFHEAWHEHAWRPPRLRHEATLAQQGRRYTPAIPQATPARIAIRTEQGLGDTIFFLRFAPALRAAGATLDFVGDSRLHGMLMRTGLFEAAVEKPTQLTAASRAEVLAGDLPLIAPQAALPPPLPLPADASRLEEMRARLASCGPAPFAAIAWRAGEAQTGAHETLLKEAPFEALAAALGARQATLVSVQRDPRPGERAALEQALGHPVHDLSAVNNDLEAALALMHAVDDYVGVSSTLVHLRAGAGRAARVLIPFPPDWRWMAAGVSPWFPGITLWRQRADGGWAEEAGASA